MAFEMVAVNKEIDILGFNSIYYFELDKNFYHTPEKHYFWEMVYVDSGKINAIIDGLGCELSQGQVVFHKPMELHSHISNKKDPNNILVVSFTCHSKIMDYFNKKIFHLEKNTKKILSLFMQEAKSALTVLPNEFENKSPVNFEHAKLGSVQLMQCYLTEFLFALIRSGETSAEDVRYTEGTKRMAESALVTSIEAYFSSNLYRTISLQDVCDTFLMSKTYLCRIFKETTGKSPMDFFLGMKMKEAKKLIREEQYNITQISDKLGYASIHHFTRMFKRTTGFSPTVYKKSIG